LVALLRTSDSHQTLVVVVLRFVDLDDAATELAYFIDLGTTFSDDRSHHIVGNEDLLGDGLSRERGTSLHRLLRRSRAWLGRTCVTIGLRLLRTGTNVGRTRRASTIAHLSLRVLHRRLSLLVGHGVLWRGGTARLTSLSTAVLIRVAHLATSVL
jgi:hypothetical protein